MELKQSRPDTMIMAPSREELREEIYSLIRHLEVCEPGTIEEQWRGPIIRRIAELRERLNDSYPPADSSDGPSD